MSAIKPRPMKAASKSLRSPLAANDTDIVKRLKIRGRPDVNIHADRIAQLLDLTDRADKQAGRKDAAHTAGHDAHLFRNGRAEVNSCITKACSLLSYLTKGHRPFPFVNPIFTNLIQAVFRSDPASPSGYVR